MLTDEPKEPNSLVVAAGTIFAALVLTGVIVTFTAYLTGYFT